MQRITFGTRVRTRWAPVAAVSVFVTGALFGGACGYEVQLSPAASATPGPLNVHVVGGASPTPAASVELAGLLRQYLGTPAAVNPASAPVAPVAVSAAPVPGTPTPAPAALAVATAVPQARLDLLTAAAPRALVAETVDEAPPPAVGATAPMGQPASAVFASAAGPVAPESPPAPAATRPPAQPAIASAGPAIVAAVVAPPPTRTAQTGVRLQTGINDLIYTGAALPAAQAFAALAGLYDIVYISPAGENQTLSYRPGSGPGPLVLTGSFVRIVMLRAATVDLPVGPGN